MDSHPPRLTVSKRWRVFLLAFVLVTILGPYVYSRLNAGKRKVSIYESGSPTTLEEENVKAFSILIFNIAHGRGIENSNFREGGQAKQDRIREIAEFVKQQNADIVVLNEVDFCCTWSGHQNQAEQIAKIAGYRYRGEQRNLDFGFAYGCWQFGNAVLSKFPIVNTTEIDYPAKSTVEAWFAGKKSGAIFSIQFGSNDLGILPVHLEHRSEDVRNDSAKVILKHLQTLDCPTVLAGDFNSTPVGSDGAASTPDGQNTMDTLAKSGKFSFPAVSNNGYEPTFPSTNPTKAIDWILAPEACGLLEYRVIECKLSDHLPVFARIGVETLQN